MDLDSLIREVLSQASAAGSRKQAESEKDRLLRERLARQAEEGATGRTAMQYGPGGASDRGDTAATARAKMAEEGATGRSTMQYGPGGQGDRNEVGAMARTRLTESGATGRAEMQFGPGGQGDRNIAGQLKGHEMQRDWTTRGQDIQQTTAENVATIGLGRTTDPRSELLKTWAGSMNPTPESLDVLQKGYENLFAPKSPAPEKGAGASFSTPDQSPAMTTASPIVPASAITPARKALAPAPDVSWNSKPAVFGESPGLRLNEKVPVYVSPAQQAEDERLREEAKKKRRLGL